MKTETMTTVVTTTNTSNNDGGTDDEVIIKVKTTMTQRARITHTVVHISN